VPVRGPPQAGSDVEVATDGQGSTFATLISADRQEAEVGVVVMAKRRREGSGGVVRRQGSGGDVVMSEVSKTCIWRVLVPRPAPRHDYSELELLCLWQSAYSS